MRPPRTGGMADPSAFRRRRAVVVAILALVVAGAVVAVVMASRGDSGRGAEAKEAFDGTVYVESNSAAPRQNSILAFRYSAGNLRPLSVREYPTGGTGIADLSNDGGLDAEQQITLNGDRTLLFSVNSRSDSIAVFHVAGDGTLTPVKGSPFPSLGRAPASVGAAGDTLFVANKTHDPGRRLKATPASYASFHVGADGSLSPNGNPVDVPPRSSPTEAYPIPGRPLMVGTEETGKWRVFHVDANGRLATAPGSPLKLDRSVYAPKPTSFTAWPQGIVAHPKLPLLYAGVANLRKLVVYEYDATGRLSLVDQQINQGTFLPCWTEISADGSRLYTGNAGSQNISVYDTGTDPRRPRQIQRVTLHGAGNPWNFSIDPSGHYLFMLNTRAVRQVPPGTGNTLHSFRIGADGRLTELPSSPVAVPVRLGTSPWGLAVAPRR